MSQNFSSCLKMAFYFTKTMIVVLVICNMATSKADQGYTKPELVPLVRHQEALIHQRFPSGRQHQEFQRFGVTNNTTMNQKLWLNMKQMLGQLYRKQMNPQTKLSDLFLLRDAIKHKKIEQEIEEKSSKATSLKNTFDKNRGMKIRFHHVKKFGSNNGSKVFPIGINIPKANSKELNIFLKFLDRIIKNRINSLNKGTNNSFVNMTTESKTVEEKAEIQSKNYSLPKMMIENATVDENTKKADIATKVENNYHPNMMVETATVDENPEKVEILRFITTNSVNTTIQSTPLDKDSEKMAILKSISGYPKTDNGDLSQQESFEKPNNFELSKNLTEQNLATEKNIEELNREIVITTIQTFQNDDILNQNRSQDNEPTHLNSPDEIMKSKNTQFTLPRNLSNLENDVSNEMMPNEELETRKRQKSDPHRHPTERDVSKQSLDKSLPLPNKVNGGRHRDKEGHLSKYRNGVNQMQMYTDNSDASAYNDDTLDNLVNPEVNMHYRDLGEEKKAPEEEDCCMGLMETLILIMICILATQCCILAVLYVLKDQLIVNLTFKYGQIKV